MTKPVRLVDEARDELAAEGMKYGLGFTRAVRAAFKLIARFPEAWAAYPKRRGVRRFVIMYRELADEIRVLAIAAKTTTGLLAQSAVGLQSRKRRLRDCPPAQESA